MICCKSVSKGYKGQKVLSDFSYRFEDNGFYLLYGESGSGKTTLLNMLAGHIPYDAGKIYIEGVCYEAQVKADRVNATMDYITQDANFIDYLTVYDNLEMCTTDSELIDKYLEEFGLSDKKYSYPGKLSGGEKQRVCIIRSLIRNKRIILLDEPTASLDKENKLLVFEILKKHKNDMLIICSSHDEVAKEYADECIDFNKMDKYVQDIEFEADTSHTEKTVEDYTSAKNVYRYIRKWFKSKFKNKKSRVRLCFVLMLAFLGISLGDTPQNKVDSSIEYIYGFNQLKLQVEEQNMDFVNNLYEREDIKEIVLSYCGSVPMIVDQSGMAYESDFDTTPWSFPLDEGNIHIDNFVQHGRYIANENEILLSDAMAMTLGTPEEVLGKTMDIKLYDGTYSMTIVGIMKEFSEAERQYLHNMGISIFDEKEMYDDLYCISAAITNKYLEDKEFFSIKGGGGVRHYTLFFESYDDMMDFYNEYEEITDNMDGVILSQPYIELSLVHVFNMMNKYIYPIAIFVMAMAILFYYQTQKTELMYNKKIFAVFQYLGYKTYKVKMVWMLYSVFELLKVFIVSGVMAFTISTVINIINREIKVIPFEIFTYNLQNIFIMFAITATMGIVNGIYLLRKIKSSNISENLVEQRDLI